MPTLWLITDNKPGHRSQLQGLAQAMAARTAIETHWIDTPRARHALLHWLSARFPPGAGLPDPDFILVAGHRTHLAGLAARRARGGRLIALMRPSLPLGCFDLHQAGERRQVFTLADADVPFQLIEIVLGEAGNPLLPRHQRCTFGVAATAATAVAA